jgi:hypothetical protein
VLLGFLAEHRIVLVGHVQRLLGISERAAADRLRVLVSAGFVRRDPLFHRRAACHQITRKGLAAIESDLRPPGRDLRSHQHDVGMAWLWLAARAGSFGALAEVVTERRMRSHDATADGRGRPVAIRLGGVGPGGGPRLHYPDLLLVDQSGGRIAIELELTSKGRTRREGILAGYGADPRVDAVLYLAGNAGVARHVRDSARKLGISDRIIVQRARLDSSNPTLERPSRTVQRTRPAAARSGGVAIEASP